MISFIDEHRSVFGVEPICRLLPIAPSTYYENVAKRLDVDRLSVRARSDIGLKIEIRRVFNENFQAYGVRKVWRQLQREGFDIARCTVARLMRVMGLQGIIRGKPIRTTISDKTGPCPLDQVNRHFFAPAPNMLWLSDFTYGAPRPIGEAYDWNAKRKEDLKTCLPPAARGMSPSGGDLPSTGSKAPASAGA